MDHAEVRDRLDQAAVEPGLLTAVGTSAFGHLSVCSECLAEYRALERVADVLALSAAEEPAGSAAPGAAPGAFLAERQHAPDDLRDRTLAFVKAHGVARGVASPVPDPVAHRPWFAQFRAAPAWITMAAAAVLVIGVAAAGLALVNERDAVVAEKAGLAAVTATADQIVRQPDHHVVTLTPVGGGNAGGSLTWSPAAGKVVVLSSALPAPAEGSVYKCWVEQASGRTVLGEMAYSNGVAYWSGPIDAWGGEVPAGARFGISLAQADGSVPGTPLLVGTYD